MTAHVVVGSREMLADKMAGNYAVTVRSTLIRLSNVISNAYFLGLTEQGLDGDEDVVQTM